MKRNAKAAGCKTKNNGIKECITKVEGLLRLPEPDTVGAKLIWDECGQGGRSKGFVNDKNIEIVI